MALSKDIQHLEEKIAAAVERTVLQVRQGIEERLRQSHEDLLGQLGSLASGLPSRLLDEDEWSSLITAAADKVLPAAGPADPVRGLHQAVSTIDGARSQREILDALNGAATRFASRAAIFLTRDDTVSGWSAQGFGDDNGAFRQLRWPPREQSAWERLAEGRGTVELDAGDRADLGSRLEAEVPRRAVLIPLVLHDRIAAALYADELTESDTLDLESLQMLTHVAALALETLPFRQRSSTPTLRRWKDAPDGAGLGLWPPRGPEEAPSEAVAMATTEESIESGEEIAAPEIEGIAGFEEIEEPEVAGDLEPAVEPVDLDATTEGAELLGEPADVEVAEPELGEPEIDQEVDVDGVGWALEETPEPEEAPVAEAPEEHAAAASEPAGETWPGAVAPPPDVPPEVSPPPPETAVAPPPPEPSAAGGAASGGAQVQPPTDVRGPGWAFTASPEVADDDETRHEEAKRLARLLVSEIKLYNEEQIERGRQENNVYDRLKEDIDRSRQLYEERVDERVREMSDYFYHELVRVLAGGDPVKLGMR